MSGGLPTAEKQRQSIVRAFDEEGLTYQQIAHLLGIGEATVSRELLLHRETGGVTPLPLAGGNFSPTRAKVAKELQRNDHLQLATRALALVTAQGPPD